ncbi:BQ5605_C004g02782 [Microbotryum silenes-dioicae]|uniref:BQ5605_C004g02782 protein n=1 Tax=Microbotryum silenes-dioicae TaxID=796604 RepID=A0A2X0MVX0_9BASI|nr:BQ5605_C004g02782 [Microbotryum silenes-dioicae]
MGPNSHHPYNRLSPLGEKELVFDAKNKFLEYWADSPMIIVTADVVDISQPMLIATVPIKWHARSKPTFKWDHVHRVAQMAVVESGHLLNDKLERVDMATAPATGKYCFVTDEDCASHFMLVAGPISKRPKPSPGVHRCQMPRQQHRKQLQEVFRDGQLSTTTTVSGALELPAAFPNPSLGATIQRPPKLYDKSDFYFTYLIKSEASVT